VNAAWARPQVRSLAIRAKQDQSTSQGRSVAPSTPTGLSGAEAPLGANATVAPVGQAGQTKADRIAYICAACGYVYDLDTPFEELDNSYQCPGTYFGLISCLVYSQTNMQPALNDFNS
jgi:hypothetical protein